MKIHLTLTDNQINILSKYLSDISKIIGGSIVVDFFITRFDSYISPISFAGGIIIMLLTLIISIQISK